MPIRHKTVKMLTCLHIFSSAWRSAHHVLVFPPLSVESSSAFKTGHFEKEYPPTSWSVERVGLLRCKLSAFSQPAAAIQQQPASCSHKHATNPSNIDDTANFPTNRVMGGLWDDQLMNLGYPSKFYRVQDATLIDGSSI